MSKKRKVRKFWHKQFHVIHVDTFCVDVGIAVNMNADEVYSSISKVCSNPFALSEFKNSVSHWTPIDPHDGSRIAGQMHEFGGGFVVILNAERNNFRNFVGTLTHEMVHVTQYLLRNRRVPLSVDTEEVHAYLTQHLVEQSLQRLYD